MKPTGIPLIGLTGTNASGKGEAARFFMEAGFDYFSLSDVIREEIRRRGEAETRNILIQTGNELRETHGADVLARRVMARIKKESIIDSIRNPSEIEFFRRHQDFTLLAIDAPAAIRYGRSQRRGRDESARTLEEFIAKEQEEMTDNKKGQQLRNCMKMADVFIMNDGSLEDFHTKLERFL